MFEAPLAERMRPKTLQDYLGQGHLVGTGQVLRRSIEGGLVPTMFLGGPPGVVNTTLARIIAEHSERPFHQISAINSGVKEVREVLAQVSKAGMFSGRAILFIDEIHRFSKSQQDSLLGAVEKGLVTLIGATTENPSFEVIPALISRCQTYVLEGFNESQMKLIVQGAIDRDALFSEVQVDVKEWEILLRSSSGDARKLLNVLELLVDHSEDGKLVVTNALVKQVVHDSISRYDKKGESHYDIASALIKSIRGSDPNAAVYYLARMVAGGEDPKFIARRLIISASEDIGMANPTALVIANEAFTAVERIGMPEGRIILAQCVIYMATSPKSNASYAAIARALEEVEASGDLAVPIHLRNAPNAWMKSQGFGKGYSYDHDAPDHFSGQEFQPEQIAGKRYYEPGSNPKEDAIRQRQRALWKSKYGY
jgi:putative ATPase